jgi:hypothetical protein
MLEHLVRTEAVTLDATRDPPAIDRPASCQDGDVALEEVPVDLEPLEVVLGRSDRSVVAQPGVRGDEAGDGRDTDLIGHVGPRTVEEIVGVHDCVPGRRAHADGEIADLVEVEVAG